MKIIVIWICLLYRRNLTESSSEITEVDDKVEETTEKVEQVNNQIEEIKARVDNLKKAAQELRENATRVQEMDVSGWLYSSPYAYGVWLRRFSLDYAIWLT